MKSNVEAGIREYIRRTMLAMENLPAHCGRVGMIEKTVGEELAKVGLCPADDLIYDVLKEVAKTIWDTNQKDLQAKIRHVFIAEYIDESRGVDLIWLKELFRERNQEELEYWVATIQKKINQKGCTKALVRKTLRQLKFKYPYRRDTLLQKIYTDALFEIGGHFTLNSAIATLRKRGLCNLKCIVNALNEVLQDGYWAGKKQYVVDLGEIQNNPSNSNLWPNKYGFYFRKAKDEYDRGF